jgi:hypothetical protein
MSDYVRAYRDHCLNKFPPEPLRTAIGVSVALLTLATAYSSESYTVPFLGGFGLYIFACNILAYLCEYDTMYFEGRILDPRGGPRWKNFFGRAMAAIGQFKERRKFAKFSALEHESFHEQENHPFWYVLQSNSLQSILIYANDFAFCRNESYYYNGQDKTTDDRIISRISRHAEDGSKTFIFLLIDSAEHGYLCIEEDVPVEDKSAPSCLGLRYEMIEPMKRWRIKFDGLARKGHRVEGAYEPITEKNGVRVQIDLEVSRIQVQH